MGQRIGRGLRINKNSITCLALGPAWLVLSLISINHIFEIKVFPFLSVTVLGLMGWAVILLSLILLTRCFRRQAFVVFLLFFSFGAWFGPFLEPPADPFEHLRRTHNYCEKKADELQVLRITNYLRHRHY